MEHSYFLSATFVKEMMMIYLLYLNFVQFQMYFVQFPIWSTIFNIKIIFSVKYKKHKPGRMQMLMLIELCP